MATTIVQQAPAPAPPAANTDMMQMMMMVRTCGATARALCAACFVHAAEVFALLRHWRHLWRLVLRLRLVLHLLSASSRARGFLCSRRLSLARPADFRRRYAQNNMMQQQNEQSHMRAMERQH